jgi:hypothetical protein
MLKNFRRRRFNRHDAKTPRKNCFLGVLALWRFNCLVSCCSNKKMFANLAFKRHNLPVTSGSYLCPILCRRNSRARNRGKIRVRRMSAQGDLAKRTRRQARAV